MSLQQVCSAPDCSESVSKRCGRYRIARYCSSECQKAHWKEHKLTCHKQKKAEKLKTPTVKKSISFFESISYTTQDEEWKVNEDIRKAVLLKVFTCSYNDAKVELAKILVIIGQNGARVKPRLSFRSGVSSTSGVELGYYEPKTREIIVRNFDPDNSHPLLMTLIHELMHAWFHQVAVYPKDMEEKVDKQEEGACEFFAFILLAKKFNSSYARSLVSKAPLYAEAFEKLHKKLKPPEDASVITYQEIQDYLYKYVKSRRDALPGKGPKKKR